MALSVIDKRFSQEGNKNYHITKMWDLHHAIARLIVLGFKYVDIATKLNITPQTVSNAANNPVVKRQIALLRGAADKETIDISQKIKELAPKAVQVMEEVMDQEGDVSSRRLAAKDILEMSGHKAVSKIAVGHAHLTIQDIEEIKANARSAGYIADGQDVEEANIVEEDNENL